jgi:uncharacterized small protein (DUF1192 family)
MAAAAVADLRSREVHEILGRLRTVHHITQHDEDVLRDSIRGLEADLNLQKRRLHHRIKASGQFQSEQAQLHDAIAQLQEEVTRLAAQLAKKVQQVAALQRDLSTRDAELERLHLAQQQLHQAHSSATEEQTVLAKCDFFPVSSAMAHDDVYSNPGGFLQAVIQAARATVIVMTHAFTNGELGAALAVASKRGVDVRVLYDAAWMDATLSAGPSSVQRASWQRVYRRWKNSTIQHAGQLGAKLQSHVTARHLPFHHNVIVVDSTVMITGSWVFADEHHADMDSSFVILTAQEPGQNPCIASCCQLFEQLWSGRKQPSLPRELTTVRLPKL